MKKFKFIVVYTKCFHIFVEAETEDSALAKCKENPFRHPHEDAWHKRDVESTGEAL